ncbi:MAG: PIN domain-containing protein [Chloroflexota bacterium]
MKTNYILIDYENIQPTEMTVLDPEQFHVILFVGAKQHKIAFEVVSALQSWGPRAEYIKISETGANTLDFHIAFYIGQLAAHEADAYFHIISKDKGFDPLIQHLKGKKIRAGRLESIMDIPIVKAATAHTLPEKLTFIVTNLQQRGTAKPRTVTTLTSTINTLFQKRLTETELSLIIKELQKQGSIIINDAKVSYTLSA